MDNFEVPIFGPGPGDPDFDDPFLDDFLGPDVFGGLHRGFDSGAPPTSATGHQLSSNSMFPGLQQSSSYPMSSSGGFASSDGQFVTLLDDGAFTAFDSSQRSLGMSNQAATAPIAMQPRSSAATTTTSSNSTAPSTITLPSTTSTSTYGFPPSVDALSAPQTSAGGRRAKGSRSGAVPAATDEAEAADIEAGLAPPTEGGAGAGGRAKSRRTSAKAASARISAAIEAERAGLKRDRLDADDEVVGDQQHLPPAQAGGSGGNGRGHSSGTAAGRLAAASSGSAAGSSHAASDEKPTSRAAQAIAAAAAAAAAAASAATGDYSDEEEDGDEDDDGGSDSEGGEDGAGGGKRRRRGEGGDRLARSRERNRVHARKSRLRKKFFVDSLKANLEGLDEENRRLRSFLEAKTGKSYEQLLKEEKSGQLKPAAASSSVASRNGGGSSGSSGAAAGGDVDGAAAGAGETDPRSLLAGPDRNPNRLLEFSDYSLVEALTKSQTNFVVSDPNLPDNPIVFASHGFYELTGYTPAEVIGRNCRFLQGPATDPEAIVTIRRGIAQGNDTAVCLINYKKDGTPFWNRFYVAPLRGVDGLIVNFIGVQCEVKESIARHLIASQKGNQAQLMPMQPPVQQVPSAAAGAGSASAAASSSSSSSSSAR